MRVGFAGWVWARVIQALLLSAVLWSPEILRRKEYAAKLYVGIWAMGIVVCCFERIAYVTVRKDGFWYRMFFSRRWVQWQEVRDIKYSPLDRRLSITMTKFHMLGRKVKVYAGSEGRGHSESVTEAFQHMVGRRIPAEIDTIMTLYEAGKAAGKTSGAREPVLFLEKDEK